MTDDEKDPVAQSMVAKRWAKTSAKQRSELARKMNEARWSGHVAKRPASSRKKKSKKKS
jgi:hypothetical protein